MTTTSTEAPIRVRIAPSPTGDPHVGTAYIGLLNFIYARQRGGKFVLRIEDTDRTRFVSTSEQMIFDTLRWLGLGWDEGPDVGGPYGPYRQSERTEIYRQHADLLLANGTAYRCFCTAEELDAARKQQIAAKLPPRYPGTCRHLTTEQIEANLAANKPFVIRMAVPIEGATTFRDELRGDITFEHSTIDDQVLMKSDGFPTYHLANVVDDHLMHITDVIRAEEWISSTPKHVLLYNAFGWQLPRFWHMPLLRNIDKSKISKRKNPVSLIYYRQAGFLPEALINFLGLMGGGMPSPTPIEIVNGAKESEIFSLDDMIERFEVPNIRLGGPVFDLTKLRWLNSEYIRALSPDAFYTALRSTILSDAYLREIAPLIQQRVETLGQFGDLTSFFFRDDVL
ncbi:MAG TPA: glutamate--tRNA ligase, partial [Edaphobacter sp.]|uniref:glutamate--tRNA ligase n=1 Tax=Edaphobacter sp. TaxID=1934404 RepID=UPI002BD8D5CB